MRCFPHSVRADQASTVGLGEKAPMPAGLSQQAAEVQRCSLSNPSYDKLGKGSDERSQMGPLTLITGYYPVVVEGNHCRTRDPVALASIVRCPAVRPSRLDDRFPRRRTPSGSDRALPALVRRPRLWPFGPWACDGGPLRDRVQNQGPRTLNNYEFYITWPPYISCRLPPWPSPPARYWGSPQEFWEVLAGNRH